MIFHFNQDGCMHFVSIIIYNIFRGVPIIYYKNVIEMMFDKNLNLESNGKKYQAMLYDRTRLIGDKIKIVTFQE